MTDSMYEDGAINSRLENVTALYDEDGSVKFVNDSLSSSNFDGSIFSITASVGVSQVSAGQLISIESSSAISFYPIIKVEEEDPVLSSPYTGAHYIYYFDGNEITTASYSSSAASVVVKYDDWDNKDLGTAGWTITSNGNAIFSNIAARGRIEATSGYIGDAYSGWEIGANLLSNASVGFYAPSAFSSTEIAIFSGSPFTGRATAPFRVNYGGQMNATGASISGALTATTLNVGGSAGITYDGSVVTIGSSVIINSGLTANSLQVGASPTLLRIANDVQGTNDGIYIDPYNFWYSDGKFSVGGSANSACWNGNALSVKGNIIATSGSFSGDITAAAGRFTGSVTVSSGGKFIAGTVDNGVVLDDSGLTGFSNGSTMFRIPTTGSPTLAGFTIINSGLTGSGQNANIIVGNTGSAANSITIRGDKTGGQNAAIFTVQSGVATSSATGNGFYVDDAGRMRLAGSVGSLTFDGNNLSVTGSVRAQHITASAGNIGGWTVTSSALYNNKVQIMAPTSSAYNYTGTGGSGATEIGIASLSTNVRVGMFVSGTGVAANTYVTEVEESFTTIVRISRPLVGTLSGTNNLTFYRKAIFVGESSLTDLQFAPFQVDYAGNLLAQNAAIIGDITATNITASIGNIAGFTLAKNQLSATNIILSSSGGFRLGNNNQFSVTTNGLLSASSASIIGDSVINGTNIGNGAGNIASNLRIGEGALSNIINVGEYNTAIGASALLSNRNGDNNIAIGDTALISNRDGSLNTAIGRASLSNLIDTANNVAIGTGTLNSASAPAGNVAIGEGSLFYTKDASFNVAIGYYSMQSSSSGWSNVAIGTSALRYTVDGANVAVGTSALGSGSAIKYNIAVGALSGYNLISGSGNVFIGGYRGPGGTHNNRIYISDGNENQKLTIDENSEATFYGNVVIPSGKNLTVDTNTLFVDGGNNEVGIGTVSPASALHVVGGIYVTADLSASTVQTTSNGVGQNFKVGDDVWIGDINKANVMSIRGVQDSNVGYILFGGSTASLGYNGTALVYGGPVSLTGTSITLGTSSAATEVRSQAIFDTLTANAATVQIAGSGNNYRLQRSTASSRKWKHDIKDMPSILQDVLNLRPVTFKYNLDYLPPTDNRSGLDVYGLIAEEVADVIPLAADYDEGQPSDWNFRILVPILIKAIQEQQKQIEQLSDRINSLGGNDG